jgi:hypothetical protein
MNEIPQVIDMNDPIQREAYHASLIDGYKKDSRLSMSLMLFCALREEDPIARSVNRDVKIVKAAAKAFEQEVWFDGGLQDNVVHSGGRGHSFNEGSFSALVYTIAGRTMITLSDNEKLTQVTLITSEDEPPREDGSGRMGIQSADATSEDAVALINKVRQLQRAGEFQVFPSEEVDFAGL